MLGTLGMLGTFGDLGDLGGLRDLGDFAILGESQPNQSPYLAIILGESPSPHPQFNPHTSKPLGTLGALGTSRSLGTLESSDPTFKNLGEITFTVTDFRST